MTPRVYIDTSVLFRAHRGEGPLAERAISELTRTDCDYVTSVFVELEALPMAEFHKRFDEIAAYRRFLSRSIKPRLSLPQILAHARYVGVRDGLAGIDACHLAVAELAGCESIVSVDSDFARSSIVRPVVLKPKAKKA
jgi:predicted nucleic acid-binding protein